MALGSVYNNNSVTIHSRPLPADHLKVTITIPIENDTELPVQIEDKDIFTILDVVGTYVAWPSNLIKLQV